MRSAPRISVDPRRKLGRHGGARKLLAEAEIVPAARGAWHDLVSALQRHTVHSELAQLPREDRHILSLAYVHGHSNREIAAMLNVSVRTVSRRLTAALARLEESARRAGAWISILGLGLVAVSARLAGGARPSRGAAAALAAGATATAVAVSFAVASPGTFGLPGVVPPSLARPVPAVLPVVRVVVRLDAMVGGDPAALDTPAPAATAEAPVTVTAASSRVCGGNPTSAAPPVPVGHRPGEPPAQPVTHPGPGGCGR